MNYIAGARRWRTHPFHHLLLRFPMKRFMSVTKNMRKLIWWQVPTPLTQWLSHQSLVSIKVPAPASLKTFPRGHQGDPGVGRERKLICMKHLLLLTGLGGMKRPEDTTLQPRCLRRLCPVSVPIMAWAVLLFGLLAYGSGQRKGLWIFLGDT